jgi:hypothetical protein
MIRLLRWIACMCIVDEEPEGQVDEDQGDCDKWVQPGAVSDAASAAPNGSMLNRKLESIFI